MDRVYHFTDTARLPWILAEGILKPGNNSIAGYPNPDFLWATADERGDLTASADNGEPYRLGHVRRVRFTLPASAFITWEEAKRIFPQWTPALSARLERTAEGKSKPSDWHVRAEPFDIASAIAIETRSYSTPWRPLEPSEPLDLGSGWLGVEIAQSTYASRKRVNPNGANGYEIARMSRDAAA